MLPCLLLAARRGFSRLRFRQIAFERGAKRQRFERDRGLVRLPVVGKMKHGRQVEVHALIELRKVPVGM